MLNSIDDLFLAVPAIGADLAAVDADGLQQVVQGLIAQGAEAQLIADAVQQALTPFGAGVGVFVQMPSGIPVATVAINGAKNAAVLAAQILAVSDDALAAKLDAAREDMAKQIAEKEAKLQAELAQ